MKLSHIFHFNVSIPSVTSFLTLSLYRNIIIYLRRRKKSTTLYITIDHTSMINPYSFITPNHLFPNLSVSSTLAVWMISGPPVPGGSNRQSLIRQSSLCICLYSRAINLTQGHRLSTTITLRPVSLDQSSRAVDLNKGLLR